MVLPVTLGLMALILAQIQAFDQLETHHPQPALIMDIMVSTVIMAQKLVLPEQELEQWALQNSAVIIRMEHLGPQPIHMEQQPVCQIL